MVQKVSLTISKGFPGSFMDSEILKEAFIQLHLAVVKE